MLKDFFAASLIKTIAEDYKDSVQYSSFFLYREMIFQIKEVWKFLFGKGYPCGREIRRKKGFFADTDAADFFCQTLTGVVLFLNFGMKTGMGEQFFGTGKKRGKNLRSNALFLIFRKKVDAKLRCGGKNPLELAKSAEGAGFFFQNGAGQMLGGEEVVPGRSRRNPTVPQKIGGFFFCQTGIAGLF